MKMTEKVFKACERKKNAGRGVGPTWDELAKLHGFKSGRSLLDAFVYESKRRAGKTGKANEETHTYTQTDTSIRVVCASKRMLTEDDVIEQFKIDRKLWRVAQFQVKTHEGYRKDRVVRWDVKGGVVQDGYVRDSGNMLVVPMYSITLDMERRVEEVRNDLTITDMLGDAKKWAPQYPKLKYPKVKDGCMYEIEVADLHFGRQAWWEESGADYDIHVAKRDAEAVVARLLEYARGFPISTILLPIGNDWFNVNGKTNATVRGTPQQEDTRWQKTFRLGRLLATSLIDACASVAPVEVPILRGNHDEERVFYLGEALLSWYRNCSNVTVDNTARTRKYKAHGLGLLGLSHGSEEKRTKLPMLMALEMPTMWAASKYREFHIGHLHHKATSQDVIDQELEGVLVRNLRALTHPDNWTTEKGLVGADRAAEAFVWSPDEGVVGTFSAKPDAFE